MEPSDEGLVRRGRRTVAGQVGRSRPASEATLAGVVATAVEARPTARRRSATGAQLALASATLGRTKLLPAEGLGATSALTRILPTKLLPGIPGGHEVRD